jgi:putative phosphoribosyl transferase
MGAIASGGVLVLNEDVVASLRIPDEVIERAAVEQREELTRRERAYRNHRPAPEVAGHSVILVDDGLATGASMHSAVEGLRKQSPGAIIVAVPVAARQTIEKLRSEVDDLVCAEVPESFHGVGQWYEDFSQTADEEIRLLLQQAYEERRLSSETQGNS